LSADPSLAWDIIRDNIDKPWNWLVLSLGKFQGWK